MPPVAPSLAKKDRRASRRPSAEAIYLGAMALLMVLIAVGLLLLPAWEIFVPAIGISFVFGISVATLAYGFLGSQGHDAFKWRYAQLGGATAAVAILVLISNGPLDRQLRLIERLQDMTAKAQAAEDRAKAAEEKANRELVVERGSTQALVGGGQIELEDINTLNGWNEGPHSENKQRPDRVHTFEKIFRKLDIPVSAQEALAMDEAQWREFVARLPQGKRTQLGGIPFARVNIQSSDGKKRTVIAFKKDAITVRNKQNQVEAYVCIRRVLDVRERRSDEPEIIVLTHSRDRCR